MPRRLLTEAINRRPDHSETCRPDMLFGNRRLSHEEEALTIHEWLLDRKWILLFGGFLYPHHVGFLGSYVVQFKNSPSKGVTLFVWRELVTSAWVVVGGG